MRQGWLQDGARVGPPAPASHVPGPAAAWKSMGMPSRRSQRSSLVFPALLGRGWITGE